MSLGERSTEQRYFIAIEEQFGRLRGRPLLLAPLDVALVRQWYQQEIPLDIVRQGLERFFAREQRREQSRRMPSSLQLCIDDVYELWDSWRHREEGDDREPGEAVVAPGARTATQQELVRSHLEAVTPRLERARQQAESAAATSLVRALDKALRASSKIGAHAGDVPMSEVEQQLAQVEKKLIRAARSALGDDGLRELEDEVRRQVEPLAGDIDDRAFRILLRKAEERAVLARFRIPRMAMFSF